MSHRGDEPHGVLSGGKEAAPPDFLARLERTTQAAYRGQQRARRTRRTIFGACAALAAIVPVVWVLDEGDALTITREQIKPVSDRPAPVKATTGAVPPETTAAPQLVEQPEPAQRRRTAEASAKPRPPALSQEVAVLSQARRALEGGEPEQALTLLDRHAAALKAGQLRLEAEVLRLEALSKLGSKREASQRAQLFIEQNPDSPLTDRVRGYVEQ